MQYGGSRVARSWIRLLVAALLVAGTFSPVMAAPAGRPDAKAKPTPLPIGELMDRVNALADGQRQLAGQLADLSEELTAAQRSVSEGRDEVRENRDELQSILDQVKGMREEVRGLYVESSGFKGDIAQVGKQVEGLDISLGNFRLSAGIVVAAIIVLQIVLVGLTFRGRG